MYTDFKMSALFIVFLNLLSIKLDERHLCDINYIPTSNHLCIYLFSITYSLYIENEIRGDKTNKLFQFIAIHLQGSYHLESTSI